MRIATVLAVLLIQLAPSAAPAPQGLPNLDSARQHFLAGRFKEAADMYAALLVVQPGLEQAHVQLIRTRLEGNDVAGSVAAARQAVEAVPNSASVWAAAGDVQYRVSQFTQATQLYKQALQLDNKSARAYLGMGRLSRLASLNKTSREYFTKAYELDPKDPDIVLAWANTRGAPSEVSAGLEEYLKLATFRPAERLNPVRYDITTNKYLGQRQRCKVTSALQATTIPLKEVSMADALGLGALGVGSLPTSPGISVSINGAKGRVFNLRSSSETLVVTARYAKELRLPRVMDAPLGSRSDKDYVAFADRVKVGNIELQNCFVSVIDVQMINGADGGIGLSLLSDFQATLNFKKNSLSLMPLPPLPAGEAPEFLDAGVSDDKKDFARAFRMGTSLLVSTRINNNPEVLFILSIENAIGFVSSALPEAKNLGGGNLTIFGDASGCTSNCAELKFGRVTVKTTLLPTNLALANHYAGIEVGGALGYNALKQSIVTIDYRNGLVKFE